MAIGENLWRRLARRKAQRWLARLRGDPPSSVREQFAAWVQASERNAEAFRIEENRFDNDYGLLRMSALAANRGFQQTSAPHRPQRYALAAAIAAVMILSATLLLFAGTKPLGSAAEAMTLVTRTGEIRRVALDDGSSVTLDTQSSVRLELGPNVRRARLEMGRARFVIAPSREPFVILAGPVKIISRAAIIDVEQYERSGGLEVRRGTAVIASAQTAPAKLSQGEALLEQAGAAPTFYPIADRGRWTSGMLEFDNTPLERAIAEANRYSVRQLSLGDPSLKKLAITGVFHAGDVAALARILANMFDLDVHRSATGDLSLVPHDAATPRKCGRNCTAAASGKS